MLDLREEAMPHYPKTYTKIAEGRVWQEKHQARLA